MSVVFLVVQLIQHQLVCTTDGCAETIVAVLDEVLD